MLEDVKEVLLDELDEAVLMLLWLDLVLDDKILRDDSELGVLSVLLVLLNR